MPFLPSNQQRQSTYGKSTEGNPYPQPTLNPNHNTNSGLNNLILTSGVARNCRQGMRQSVAFLSVHSRSAALPSRPYSQKRHDILYRLNDRTNNDNTITLTSHTQKIMYFTDRGCVRPLRHLYGYTTDPNPTH